MDHSIVFRLRCLIVLIGFLFQFSSAIIFREYYELAAGNTTIFTQNCEVNYTSGYAEPHFFLHCKISMTQFQYYFDNTTYCRAANSDTAKSLIGYSPEYTINQNVSCVSNFPIFVKVFTSTKLGLKEELLNLNWHRILTDFRNHSSYNYQLLIQLPTKKFYGPTPPGLVKYKVYSKDFPKKSIHILWFYKKDFKRSYYLGGWNASLDDFNGIHILDGMQSGRNSITAPVEIITLPCINSDPHKTQLTLGNGTKVSMDNVSIWYNQAYGFKINISLFTYWNSLNSTYKCDEDRIYITGPPESSWTIELGNMVNNAPVLKTPFFLPSGSAVTLFSDNEANQNLQIVFTCTSTKNNVTIVTAPNWENRLGMTLESSMDVTYNFRTKPQNFYTAMAKVNISWSFLNSRRNTPEIFVKCVDTTTKIVLYKWNPPWIVFRVEVFHTPHWELDAHFPHLKVLLHNLKCYGSFENIDFRQIECHNRYSCKQLARGVFVESVEAHSHRVTQVMDASDCYPAVTNRRPFACKSLPIINKGFFVCQTTPMGETMAISYQNFYFVGFDGNLYIGNVDPPHSAIIKMEMINQTGSFLALPGNIIFSCEANSLHFENGMQWLFVFQNETEILVPPENITDITVTSEYRGNPLRVSNVQFGDKLVKQIKCAAPILSILNDGNDDMKWRFSSIKLTLEDSFAPMIELSDDLEIKRFPVYDLSVKYFRVDESNQFLKCKVDGVPPPEITWTYREMEPVSPFVIISNSNNKILQFPVYNKSFEGEYVCTATNRMGTTNQTFTVITESPVRLLKILAFSSLFALFLVTAAALLGYAVRKWDKQTKGSLTEEEIREFMDGKSSGGEENVAFSMPYNENFEILPQQFEIDTKNLLGKGAFGVVYLGTISKVNYTGNAAFKTLRPNSGSEKLKSLLSELKIMIYIGEHENVIRLIAAYTKEIHNGSVYIVTELCSLGSLESYLRNNNEEISDCESNEVHNLTKIISREQLCNWSSQIANGMDYLAFKHIVHSDLATRNILLNSDEIAKITDFGLSRQMYNCYNYVKKGRDDPLPWKWMALESLRTLTFSTQSDVWAYGITLWEMFSLGAVPYPGISWTVEFQQMLDNGTRNPKPKRADLQIYSVMLSCWNKNPRDRPSFHDLKVFFMNINKEQDKSKDENEVEEYTVLE